MNSIGLFSCSSLNTNDVPYAFAVPAILDFMHLVYASLDFAPLDDFFSPLKVFGCWPVEPIFWRRVKNLASLSWVHIVLIQELHLFR